MVGLFQGLMRYTFVNAAYGGGRPVHWLRLRGIGCALRARMHPAGTTEGRWVDEQMIGANVSVSV
ncbi:hypothetical protein IQ267_22775 [filamentous cyanobacterium LEGE 07170]|nr:hypothetical protein [filamentous cyanobacterium LEGE 07170]